VRNARLHETNIARLDELTASRNRIVSAALEERRRLERDLHDGAQQRLLAVAARLGLARATADNPVALAAIDNVREQLRIVLSELRALARDIHPAVLESTGLAAALEMTASQLDIPLIIESKKERFAPFTETAAYLTTHELLADAARSGELTRVSVGFTRHGSLLRVSIQHDGLTSADGAAVEHATDRLRALGGTLTVQRPVPGATTITADVPCE
jgi:signal transduction histidine kinase